MNSVAYLPAVTVIIVNWNGGDLLRQAVESIAESMKLSQVKLDVVIVDNDSCDNSIASIVDTAGVLIVRNDTNRGFAAACNQAAALAKGEFLLFFNPDCRNSPGAVEACIEVLRKDRSVGAVGVALRGDDGAVCRSCHRFPVFRTFFVRLSGLASMFSWLDDGSMREWPHNEDRCVDHVIGAFYMVRADDFRGLGGFDDRFFVYLEDIDLSRRYRDRGMKCYFLAKPTAYHKGGGVSEKVRATRLFYATRSRILYAFKHFRPIQAWIHLGLTISLEPLARVTQAAATGRFSRGLESVRAFALLYRDLPALFHLVRTR